SQALASSTVKITGHTGNQTPRLRTRKYNRQQTQRHSSARPSDNGIADLSGSLWRLGQLQALGGSLPGIGWEKRPRW
uniref:Uncharacterized protein n=1 Tax=Loxodonta africana TaxID=9785 RepID=G3UL09_LOXAF